jgi:Holliday junction resolvase
MSRRKGQAGEREAAAALAQLGIGARRNGQTCGYECPDVQTALPGVWCEVKRVERLNVSAALARASIESGSPRLPVVLHRPNRRPWQVTLYLSGLPKLAEIVTRAATRHTAGPADPDERNEP